MAKDSIGLTSLNLFSYLVAFVDIRNDNCILNNLMPVTAQNLTPFQVLDWAKIMS